MLARVPGMTAHQLRETVTEFRNKYPKLQALSDEDATSVVVRCLLGGGLPSEYWPDQPKGHDSTPAAKPSKKMREFIKWLDKYPPGEMPPIPDFLQRKTH